MKDKLIIHVSFKTENIEDIKLYNWICQKSSKSGFIKDIMRAEMLKEEQISLLKMSRLRLVTSRIRVYVKYMQTYCQLLQF